METSETETSQLSRYLPSLRSSISVLKDLSPWVLGIAAVTESCSSQRKQSFDFW